MAQLLRPLRRVCIILYPAHCLWSLSCKSMKKGDTCRTRQSILPCKWVKSLMTFTSEFWTFYDNLLHSMSSLDHVYQSESNHKSCMWTWSGLNVVRLNCIIRCHGREAWCFVETCWCKMCPLHSGWMEYDMPFQTHFLVESAFLYNHYCWIIR